MPFLAFNPKPPFHSHRSHFQCSIMLPPKQTKPNCVKVGGLLISFSPTLKPCDDAVAEDDTVFEKQSALFALAVSDIVLINMWCHDIGREHGANKPLLKTIFQIWDSVTKPEAHKSTALNEFFRVMIATIRCDEIANEKLSFFASDEEGDEPPLIWRVYQRYERPASDFPAEP
ncbi:hypothetical protein KSP39_PZI009017 [Platanthera zijinensis]|uniref:Uncharacterized protein n=1 Tax=Platanthera zijinensis TaxID=2320716 RepID=A0AAP0G7P3_9ASPA